MECNFICYFIKRVLLILVICYFSSLSAAEMNIGSWVTIRKIGEAANKSQLLYLIELQGRWLSNYPRNEGLLNLGGGYRINQQITLWSGYRTGAVDDIDRRRYEQRLWQRFVITMLPSYPIALTLSSQLEQRAEVDQSGVALRFRQKVSLTFTQIAPSYLQPTISDEAFLNINHPDWVINKTFGQNRFFIGAII